MLGDTYYARMPPSLSVVMLAWRDEPVLVEAVRSVLASREVDLEVVLVDNGCTSDALERLAPLERVRILDPGDNLGFAGGCNYGARHADGDLLAFINGDAVVEPDALARLCAVVADPDSDAALATASVRLYDEPDVLNTAGNPVHYTGLSWAGGLGRPAGDFPLPRAVTSASGAATVCRRDRFEALGGFTEPMFAYCEDTDLSLRAWQRGWQVRYVPEAVVLHRYEFSRNPLKFYLLERNRLFMVATVFPGRLIAAVLPVLLGLELAVLAMAVKDGWAKQKVSGWWWLLRNRRLIRETRRRVRGHNTLSDREFAALLTGSLDPSAPGLAVPAFASRLSQGYWSLARRMA